MAPDTTVDETVAVAVAVETVEMAMLPVLGIVVVAMPAVGHKFAEVVMTFLHYSKVFAV